ncbi:MAG TPA: translation elongation factor Ts [Elusimicrobiota bacterium]|jgi:elongation factor Ts|nr:translation elongation factor Ts [Elusimicrobiota bacterium]
MTASLNEMILKLREKTGAGMTACKSALVEAGNDYEKALELLRKKGLADAAKKSARTTKEGLVAAFVSPDGKTAGIVELNCETDFVAKTEEFQALAAGIAKAVAQGGVKSPEDAAPLVTSAIAKLGENMAVKRIDRYELSGPGAIAAYVHTAGGKKGALVELACGSDAAAKHEAVAGLGKELALQVVAMSPRWVSRADVPPAEVSKEKEIYTTLVLKEGKPEAAAAKIVEGKLNKLFYGAFCLTEQMSMRDNKTPISQLVEQASKAAGAKVEVKRFARYQLGGE